MSMILWDGRELSKELFTKNENNMVIVQYNVTPKETAEQDLERLHVMFNSIMENGALARECLILSFAGYDNDPRPLDAIPDVVRYIKCIADNIPNIWYFLIPELNQHMFTCLVPHTAITSPLFPRIKYDREYPAVAQRLVQLDLSAAEQQLNRMIEDLTRFGKSIGDESGAKRILNKWKSVLEL